MQAEAVPVEQINREGIQGVGPFVEDSRTIEEVMTDLMQAMAREHADKFPIGEDQ
jgi:hypothetical protein